MTPAERMAEIEARVRHEDKSLTCDCAQASLDRLWLLARLRRAEELLRISAKERLQDARMQLSMERDGLRVSLANGDAEIERLTKERDEAVAAANQRAELCKQFSVVVLEMRARAERYEQALQRVAAHARKERRGETRRQGFCDGSDKSCCMTSQQAAIST